MEMAPSYQKKSSKRGQAWFDIRVVYVRLSSCSCLVKSAPDCFRIVFPARSSSSVLEVNGGRVPFSEQTSRALRRDRVDKESAEATYVSTNNLRTNGDLPFEIHYKGEVLVTGKFLRSDSWSEGPVMVDNHACSFTTRKKLWIMECNCAISGSSFLSSKTDFSSMNAPFLEVYVAGRSLGQPVVLNQLVQFVPLRRKNSHNHCISLDVIPEDDDDDEEAIAINAHSQEQAGSERKELKDRHGLEMLYCNEGMGEEEGEEGELSWFNAGVRVGMGIGLGMCLGIGVGVGLVMRTYQVTTGRFRRGFL